MLHAGRTKHFAARLNECLDDIGLPTDVRGRSATLSKMLKIPRHQAWMLLEGHQIPDDQLLHQIAQEFEVETTWLMVKR